MGQAGLEAAPDRPLHLPLPEARGHRGPAQGNLDRSPVQGAGRDPSLRSDPRTGSTKNAGPLSIGRPEGAGSGRTGGCERYFGSAPAPGSMLQQSKIII